MPQMAPSPVAAITRPAKAIGVATGSPAIISAPATTGFQPAGLVAGSGQAAKPAAKSRASRGSGRLGMGGHLSTAAGTPQTPPQGHAFALGPPPC